MSSYLSTELLPSQIDCNNIIELIIQRPFLYSNYTWELKQ